MSFRTGQLFYVDPLPFLTSLADEMALKEHSKRVLGSFETYPVIMTTFDPKTIVRIEFQT